MWPMAMIRHRHFLHSAAVAEIPSSQTKDLRTCHSQDGQHGEDSACEALHGEQAQDARHPLFVQFDLCLPSSKRRRRRELSRRLHCGSALISRILFPQPFRPAVMIIYLSGWRTSPPLLAQWCDYYPELSIPFGTCGQAGRFSCSVLHRMRFVVPPSSRSGRWALTPPFHPCPRFHAGGLFSVTLSVTAACTAAPTLSRGMLPCGVRTFLQRPAFRQHTGDHSGRPAPRLKAPSPKGKPGRMEKMLRNFPAAPVV